jgi:hypothetical protein
VRVHGDVTMSWKVFGTGHHAHILHAPHILNSQ